MTKEEINKTIAEFMEWDFEDITQTNTTWIIKDKYGDIAASPYLFTQSLDKLVPVVKKLHMLRDHPTWEFTLECIRDQWEVFYNLTYDRGSPKCIQHESPSMALATACAKVIKQL